MKKNITNILVLCSLLLLVGAGCGTNEPNAPQNGNNTTSSPTTTPQAPDISPVSITTPAAYASVQSPILVEGMVPGNWATEGQLYITLEHTNGALIDSTTTLVQNWMTTSMVPFSASLTYTAANQMQANIVIHKGNPSGLPQNADEKEWPITLQTQTASLPFSEWEAVPVEDIGITLTLPEAFEKRSDTSNTIQFFYSGPTQAPQTELYDGISISVEQYTLENDETFTDAAQSRYNTDNTSGVKQSISERIQQTTVSGRDAYVYTYVSLGEITRYAIKQSDNTVLFLSVLDPDPENKGYREVVDLILRDIQW